MDFDKLRSEMPTSVGKLCSKYVGCLLSGFDTGRRTSAIDATFTLCVCETCLSLGKPPALMNLDLARLDVLRGGVIWSLVGRFVT